MTTQTGATESLPAPRLRYLHGLGRQAHRLGTTAAGSVAHASTWTPLVNCVERLAVMAGWDDESRCAMGGGVMVTAENITDEQIEALRDTAETNGESLTAAGLKLRSICNVALIEDSRLGAPHARSLRRDFERPLLQDRRCAVILRAGLYACSPDALRDIVDRAADKLAAVVNDPAYVVSRDRLSAYMEMIGIEVGELRKALCDEKRASEQKLRKAHDEIDRLRRELASARRAA